MATYSFSFSIENMHGLFPWNTREGIIFKVSIRNIRHCGTISSKKPFRKKSSNPLTLMILVFHGVIVFIRIRGRAPEGVNIEKLKCCGIVDVTIGWKLNEGTQAWVVSLVVSYHGNHNQWFLVFHEKWNWLGRCQNRNIWVLWGGSCI